MLKLAFEFRNQLITLKVNLVLGIEETFSPLAALGFKFSDLFLAGQFFLKSQRSEQEVISLDEIFAGPGLDADAEAELKRSKNAVNQDDSTE